MKHGLLVGVAIGLCALGVLASVDMTAQSAPAVAASGAASYTAPKTAWGHPDLQGVWTTDIEIGVPVERPVDLGEKATLTEAEFQQRRAALEKKYRDDKSDRRKTNSTEAGPEHWYEGAQHVSYRTSLVIDPPNGRIPAFTADAQKRVVKAGTELGFVGGSFGKGPYNGPEDLALTDRCITRGLPQTWYPSQYNNGFQIVQSENYVTIYYERLHEARLIPRSEERRVGKDSIAERWRYRRR